MLPTAFTPPEGWTFMARSLTEVIVGGQVPKDETGLLFVHEVFESVAPNAVVRCYVYPSMLLTVVWSPVNGLWVGSVVSR
jgi:hypothetical protein